LHAAIAIAVDRITLLLLPLSLLICLIVVLLETFANRFLVSLPRMSDFKNITTSIAQLIIQINAMIISSLSLLPQERRGTKMDN
jgi:hypothetical protein